MPRWWNCAQLDPKMWFEAGSIYFHPGKGRDWLMLATFRQWQSFARQHGCWARNQAALREEEATWEAQEQWPVEEMGGARRRAMNSIGSAPTAFGARGGLQELRLLTHWSPPLLLRSGHQLGVKRPHTVVEVGPGYEGAGVEKHSWVHLSSISKGCPLIHHMFHNYLRQHLKTPNKLHWSIITSSRTFGTSPVPWITENRQTR